MAFSYEETRSDGVLVFRLQGDLDIDAAADLKDAVKKALAAPADLEFDLTDLAYLDSMGLGVLVSLYKTVREQGGTMRVVHVRPNVYKLFSITELNRVFPVEAQEAEK